MKLIAFIVFLIAGIFITYPWIFHLSDFVTGYGDNFVYTWIHTWVIESIINGNITQIFNTNIFYPYQVGLSVSDPNISTAILSIPIYLLTREPISTVNFTTIFSIVFLGFSIYLLSYYLTKNYLASIFSGLLIAFSPAYLSFYGHLQMMSIAFTPLSILCFLIFIKTKKQKNLIISLFLFLLQTYNNFLGGYFILFSYLIIFLFNLIGNKSKTIGLISKKNIIIFISFFALIIPVANSYFSVSKEFNYKRDIRDAVHFANQPEDFLLTMEFSRLQKPLKSLPFNQVSQNSEFKPAFLGFIFSLLFLFSIFYFFKNLKRKNIYLNSFMTIAALGFVLSLGPVLHLGRQTIHNPIIPLPYALFYYIVPGFQGFRNSARWEVLMLIGASVVIAVILSKVFGKFSTKKQFIIYSLLTLVCIIELNLPLKFVKMQSIKNIPQEYHWLATTPEDTKLIEMPVYNWNMFPYGNQELWRLYYSTSNFRRTVNGTGGFTPPPWQEMAYELDENFPNEKSITKLKNLNLNYILVHKNEFDKLNSDKFTINKKIIPSGEFVIRNLNKNPELKLINRFGDTYIYSLN